MAIWFVVAVVVVVQVQLSVFSSHHSLPQPQPSYRPPLIPLAPLGFVPGSFIVVKTLH